jgi:peroxiredoxin Q/BCP
MSKVLKEGDRFPDFELPDQDGNIVSSASLRGQRVVLYFYPKDDTSGCTAEACQFRDTMPRFKGLNGQDVRILGVSPDSPKSHRKFIDKYELNFILLADLDHKLAEACGLWVEKTLYGRKYMGVERTTYLLDSEGKIERVWNKVKPEGHAGEVYAALA